jgi:glycosyltransferase involved in cell wall biosynthesis
VIVDDGSKDNSAKIAEKVIIEKPNCKLIRQENAGVSVARNNGEAVSQGYYLCFLDADDWWEPTFLEEMSRFIDEFPEAGIYGTNYTIVNETKKKTRVAPIGVDACFEKGYINYCKVYAKTLAMPIWQKVFFGV